MTATIDPRFRERRIEVQREAGRKRLRYLIAMVAVVVPLGVAFLLLQSAVLDVDHIRIEVSGRIRGLTTMDAATVERVAEVERGDPLWRVDAGAVARRIEALPAVADAEVTRGFPGTLRIVVTERPAVAYVRQDEATVALVAADGTLIAQAATAPAGMIEVRGATRVPAVGERLVPADAAGAGAAMPPELAARVAAVDLAEENVTLVLHDGITIRLCDATDLEAKGAAAVAVLQRINDRGFTSVDVCVPASPVAK